MKTIKCPNCKREYEVINEVIISQCKCGELIEAGGERGK